MFGFTENYVKIKTPFDPSLSNTIKKVQLSQLDRDGIYKSEIEPISEQTEI
jgi:threonylcarbamoyladenosine tRNA methylthiotransferase MtaB